ncbi:hypothetical protein N7491_009825 [Penicillium cf. griseofulvum]|uniref:Uncharacterized protein n=1 Tax=Penicillium cf. griseofulvum TaxID=2972120 RepID=A0A9W9MYU8_9EURO|nr:hypothetical protein N7472_000151 [Penicillium cf. griseofulvum]KAJ5421380.1 hypothetical protein N7491_009825 [Penicillium cf. griseofulvum]
MAEIGEELDGDTIRKWLLTLSYCFTFVNCILPIVIVIFVSTARLMGRLCDIDDDDGTRKRDDNRS